MERTLTKQNFDRFLKWLDPDRTRASEKYEATRLGLIKIFLWRGCVEAEDLADETMNRVAARIERVVAEYHGEPTTYLYAVANNLYREYSRIKLQPPSDPYPTPNVDVNEGEQRIECLERCLERLPEDDRTLILSFHEKRGSERVKARVELAGERGIALNALRIRAHRIRKSLEKCVRHCLEQQS